MLKYTPQEIEVWYILPALRRELALEMYRQGMKSVEIANSLGLTKSAISQYFSKSRAVEFRFSKETQEEIKIAALRVMKGSKAFGEIQRIVRNLSEEQNICKFHHTLEEVEPGCAVCFS